MLQINVAQLLKAPIGTTREYEIAGVVDITERGVKSAVQGEVSLVRTDRSILVKGKLHTEVEITCSRCLRQFTCPLTLKIEDEYYPTIDIDSGAPVALPGEPGAFIIDEHHIIDLSEVVRQYAVIAIPMKPLCREDCAGLCPTCGQNLNEAVCGCPTQVVDSRWSELRKQLASER